MKCKDENKKMLQYLDGELNIPESLAFEQHLNECESCKSELNQLKLLYALIDEEKQEYTPNPFFANVVVAKISNAKNENLERSSLRRYITITSLAAAAVFFGIVIGTIFSNNSNSFDFSSTQSLEQLADDYMPEYESDPYQFINEINQ